ncbi:saccharopine dehydrogenase family protein [Pseudaestuariivita rosea]|uniref:saccharopine dehydrogenase family protein n=1 Tax=Pseudaestuariivita rosea TaxID=2763263 RepID=UPI001ABAC843|nr:saccharopine dehydrogenase family protein [Pseudaestuariivita rosea]
MTVHWCGTGLSTAPGLRRLIENGQDIVVWNRTIEKAQAVVGDLTDQIEAFDPDALKQRLQPGDVVVSMLPADWHVPLAKMCIDAHAHFVSSSYISPEMQALHRDAEIVGVALVNEVGLDPGIDHLMAHHLVADYRASPSYHQGNHISFISYCGGIPKHPNSFRYKFSWSPVGVLKALRSPSKSIRAYSELEVHQPWDAMHDYSAPLPVPETFEVYPNRDSLPFIAQYHFDPGWTIKEFVRGTLRLNGWAEAWSDIFTEVGQADDARLKELSDQLWAANAYEENEPDRVVLCVSLLAEKQGVPVYHKTYVLDAWGDMRGSAMARLVSVPVSLAVEAVLLHEIGAGVHPAPNDLRLVQRWMAEVDRMSQHLQIVDHL